MTSEPEPREAVELAGHRIARTHDCFMMNCKGLGPEVERLTAILARSTSGQQAVRDFLADPATRARLVSGLYEARTVIYWIVEDGEVERRYFESTADAILAALTEPKPWA